MVSKLIPHKYLLDVRGLLIDSILVKRNHYVIQTNSKMHKNMIRGLIDLIMTDKIGI